MTSEVEICNSALAKVSANRIGLLTENSKGAILCNDAYPRLRDMLLRDHLWNFNKTRKALARLGTAPAFGWTYAYQLPGDFVRVHAVYADTSADRRLNEYEIEGQTLLTDAEYVYLVYGKTITDPNKFDYSFREALALTLAVELSSSFLKSSTKGERLASTLKDHLANSVAMDEMDDPNRQMMITTWDACRD